MQTQDSQMGTDRELPDLQAAQFDKDELVLGLEYDPELWIQFNLGDELTHPVPEFHKTEFLRMIHSTVSRLALAIPRGHAKTTLAKLAAAWFFVFSEYRFILYVSNTNPVAKAACMDIINYMKKENFRAVFGDIQFLRESESDGLWKFIIKNKQGREKTCILKALGAGQQVRGLNIDNQRPEITIVDDLEDTENTDTDFQRGKLKRWVYGTFFKALSKKNKIIWLGNMISNSCLLKEHCESEFWHSSRMGCLLEDGRPLWPDLWPIDEIKNDFIEYQKLGLISTWFAEMMNMPLPDGMGLIRAGEIYYKPAVDPGFCQHGFITIDPAISQRTWANHTAIVVHAIVDDVPQVVDYVFGKWDVDTIYQQAISLALKWNFFVIGIENVTFSAILKEVFQYKLLRDKLLHIRLVEVFSYGVKKTERLMGWCGALKSKGYALTEGDFVLTEQLLQYDPSKKENDDDIIDSAAYGIQMIQSYLHVIMQELEPDSIAKNEGEVQICGI